MAASDRPMITCPPWCAGCGPDDPVHRSEPVTIGRGRTGSLRIRLVVDRFARRETMIRIDGTRFGATQTVLFSAEQADQVIRELIVARRLMNWTGGARIRP